MEPQEQALRDAVLAGSEPAWRALYEANFDALYAYVFHRTGRNRHRSDDVVQETWLVAVRRISDFDPRRGAFESWLKGIAAKVLKNHRRRWQRDDRAQPLAAEPPAPPAVESSPADIYHYAFVFRDYGILVLGPNDKQQIEAFRSSGALMIAPPEVRPQ